MYYINYNLEHKTGKIEQVRNKQCFAEFMSRDISLFKSIEVLIPRFNQVPGIKLGAILNYNDVLNDEELGKFLHFCSTLFEFEIGELDTSDESKPMLPIKIELDETYYKHPKVLLLVLSILRYSFELSGNSKKDVFISWLNIDKSKYENLDNWQIFESLAQLHDSGTHDHAISGASVFDRRLYVPLKFKDRINTLIKTNQKKLSAYISSGKNIIPLPEDSKFSLATAHEFLTIVNQNYKLSII